MLSNLEDEMTSKERLVIFGFLLITMLLLPFTLKAESEQQMVEKWLANMETVKPKLQIVPFFGISYGKVTPDGYNTFATEFNRYVKYTSTTGVTALSGIYRITSFSGGVGLVVKKGMLTFGFDNWLAVGSNNKGDFVAYNDLGTGLAESINDFEMRSQINVRGVYLDYQYFLLNPPEPSARPDALSFRAGGGLGYYAGYWNLWDGFGGIRSDTGEFYVLEDALKGSGPGFHLSAGFEYPAWYGFTLAFDAKYLWLKFDKMDKRLSATYELYLVNSETGDPIQVDFTGPRASLSLRRYFTL